MHNKNAGLDIFFRYNINSWIVQDITSTNHHIHTIRLEGQNKSFC